MGIRWSCPCLVRWCVRVTATTDNLFRAVRVLLSYGPACRVLGDDEARREVKRLAEQTAAWYAGEDEKTG